MVTVGSLGSGGARMGSGARAGHASGMRLVRARPQSYARAFSARNACGVLGLFGALGTRKLHGFVDVAVDIGEV